jgi:hypothetical protein
MPGQVANSSVTSAVKIRVKRLRAKSIVLEPVNVVKERRGADSIVVVAAVVKDEGVCSNGHVLCTGGVEQRRGNANCGIGISSVEDQRSSADTGVVAAAGDRIQRIPAKACVSGTGGEVREGIGPFCRGESGIASIRWRTDSLGV